MSTMTPMQYAEKYWRLQVPIFDDATSQVKEWVTVRVDSYRLKADEAAMNDFMSKARPRLDQKDGKKNVSESLTVFVKTTQGNDDQRTYADRFALAANAKDPFYGKGCPEEVQVTLQLALRLGVIQAKPGESPQQAIQAYCNTDHLGLDCNGFVGNYIRHGLQGVSWHSDPGKNSSDIEANSTINSIMKHCTPIASVEEIVKAPHRSYVLALVDSSTGRIRDHGDDPVGHIMISEPGPLAYRPWNVWTGGFGGVNYNNVLALQVIESTGKNEMVSSLRRTGFEGLVRSDYLILEEDKRPRFTIFKVHRGSKAKTAHVRIAAVPGT
jgi:hypothetical protein